MYSKLAADALVGGGLAIEAVCIVRAIVETRREKRQSDEEIAAANARAAEAEAEAARLRQGFSWRLLRPEQKARVTENMKKFAGQQFAVLTYRTDDPESSNLGALIQESLVAAGWEYVPSQPLSWLDTGVSVEIAMASVATLGLAANHLVKSLNAEGVQTKEVHADKYNEHATIIFVVVGKKPPSRLELPVSE